MWMNRAWTNEKIMAMAWYERGQRFEALKSGRTHGRVNMIAALCTKN